MARAFTELFIINRADRAQRIRRRWLLQRRGNKTSLVQRQLGLRREAVLELFAPRARDLDLHAVLELNLAIAAG